MSTALLTTGNIPSSDDAWRQVPLTSEHLVEAKNLTQRMTLVLEVCEALCHIDSVSMVSILSTLDKPLSNPEG